MEKGDELIVTYGNGPQVGNLLLQMQAVDSAENPAMPLDTGVAMTQGSIGYWLANAFKQVLLEKRYDKQVATILSQVMVDENDDAFEQPTKPVGPVLTQEQMKKVKKENDVYHEVATNKWQKVVASPKPYAICESDIISTLLNQGVLTIACGGGGIPVGKKDLIGKEAVVDKDFVSEKIAESINADLFIILMEEDYVYLNYKKKNQEKIEQIAVKELANYEKENQFDSGEMLPKLNAASQFVEKYPERQTIITSLAHIKKIAANQSAGTVVKYSRA